MGQNEHISTLAEKVWQASVIELFHVVPKKTVALNKPAKLLSIFTVLQVYSLLLFALFSFVLFYFCNF